MSGYNLPEGVTGLEEEIAGYDDEELEPDPDDERDRYLEWWD